MNYQKVTESQWIQGKKMRLLFIKNGKHLKFSATINGLYTNRSSKEFMHELEHKNKEFQMLQSHTGSVMTMGKGVIQSISKKQKLNTRCITEAELVRPDDCSQQILWTALFMEKQGSNILRNILHQDNKSTILLEKNGRKREVEL